MAKIVRFIELHLENFTSHRSITVNFGNITKLSGRNGVGKTSIGTAPTWILYGVDLYGKTFNPSPINYEFDRVFGSLILSVNGTEYKFAREIENGKNAFYINDVPSKAKEFDAAVASLFDKEEFLALYSPFYFFSLHWTKQRELIMKYTTAPAKSEVLKALPEVQASKLDELTKKHTLDDLQKIHGGTGGQKSKLEKAHIAAQSRTKTLQEQLLLMDRSDKIDDIETAQQDIAKIDAAIAEIEQSMAGADENNRKIVSLQSKIKSLLEYRDRMKQQFQTLQAEPIADTCRVCKQPLQGESVEAAKADKERRIAEFKAEYDRIVAQRKELEAELAVLEYIDVTEKLEEIRRWQEAKQAILDAVREKQRRLQLEQEVEKARADEAATLAALKESIFILDAIKAYRAKEAEIQAEKVQSLFTTLSIRLFKYVKTTDEWEPDFSIQMDGKDYSVLSAGEKIAARLELTEVLFKQTDLIVPAFIDNIESYTGKVAVYDQLITGRAEADQELKIETEGAA
jgi:hypothetical protein